MKARKNNILKLISQGLRLVLYPSDGSESIIEAKKTFTEYIQGDFGKNGLEEKGIATEETEVVVHEMVGDGTSPQIFAELSPDLDKLVLTQHQIIQFCQRFRAWLRQKGFSTFFLMKVDDSYYVVVVHNDPNGLDVRVRNLIDTQVWPGENHRRIVSPKIV